MSQEEQAAPVTTTASCQSPPAAPMPPREELPDPRVRLLQLAAELMQSSNRRLIVEYLLLRRAIV
jgi:hypothetical protein